MRRQLQGIAILLLSILLTAGVGDAPVFHLSFRWSALFTAPGCVGAGIALFGRE